MSEIKLILGDCLKELNDYPHFEYKNGIIYQGDCLEIMPLLKNQSIDLVLTDRFILTNIHTGCILVVKEDY